MGKGTAHYLYRSDDNTILKDFKIFCITEELTMKEGLEEAMKLLINRGKIN